MTGLRPSDRPTGAPLSEDSAARARVNRAHGVPVRLVAREATRRDAAGDERLRAALSDNFSLVWRTLRRLGVDLGEADDAAQHVFLTFAARLSELEPGAERAFLIGACSRVAANARRRRVRAIETVTDGDALDRDGMNPEELLVCKERSAALDRALATLTWDHRTVFVLFELEGLSLPEIAKALSVPLGTATSRLRRARVAFEQWVLAHSQEEGETT